MRGRSFDSKVEMCRTNQFIWNLIATDWDFPIQSKSETFSREILLSNDKNLCWKNSAEDLRRRTFPKPYFEMPRQICKFSPEKRPQKWNLAIKQKFCCESFKLRYLHKASASPHTLLPSLEVSEPSWWISLHTLMNSLLAHSGEIKMIRLPTRDMKVFSLLFVCLEKPFLEGI